MKGSHPWLIILCVPSDEDTPVWPDFAYFQGLIDKGGGGLADYWSQVSGGAVDLTGSRVLGWYKLNKTRAQLDGVGVGTVAALAREAAVLAGQDISGYAHAVAFVVNSAHGNAVNGDVVANMLGAKGQSGWRWCSKCGGLSHWISGEPAKCPGGGRHEYPGGSLYSVHHGTAGVDGQGGWRWCSTCAGLVHADSGPAPCSGGGHHNTASSGLYFVRHGSTGDTTKEQQD